MNFAPDESGKEPEHVSNIPNKYHRSFKHRYIYSGPVPMGEIKGNLEQRKTVGGSPGNGPATEGQYGMSLRQGVPD